VLQPVSNSGHCSALWPRIPFSSACADSGVTPGLSFPTTEIHRPRGVLADSPIWNGLQISGSPAAMAFSLMLKLKSGGITPTTVTGLPPSVMGLPTTAGSPPKRRFQSP
jgi:hypothetical protein